MFVGYLSDEINKSDIICAGNTRKETENLLVKTFTDSLLKNTIISLATNKQNFSDIDVEKEVDYTLKSMFGKKDPSFSDISKYWFTEVLEISPGTCYINRNKVK